MTKINLNDQRATDCENGFSVIGLCKTSPENKQHWLCQTTEERRDVANTDFRPKRTAAKCYTTALWHAPSGVHIQLVTGNNKIMLPCSQKEGSQAYRWHFPRKMQCTTVQCCNLNDGSGQRPKTNQNTNKQTDRQTDRLTDCWT